MGAKERYWEEREARRVERENREAPDHPFTDFLQSIFNRSSEETPAHITHARSVKMRKMRRLAHQDRMRNAAERTSGR